jgi:hypothetical protein
MAISRALPVVGLVACAIATSQCGDSIAAEKSRKTDIIKTKASDTSRGSSVDTSRFEVQPAKSDTPVSDNAQNRSRNVMTVIDIVPGKSIGQLSLGAPTSEIVKQAKMTAHVGELNGIKFAVQDGKIDDVWIEDLREFKGEVRFRGKVISHDIPLEDLKKILGGCEKVEGVKGGIFYNCPIGITIGCDYNDRGDFVQLRLKPR